MLFSGIPFLFRFFPAVLLLYYAAPRKYKNYVLLLSSLVFYFSGEPAYTVLLLISSVSDYCHSLCIEKFRGTSKAKAALISSIVVNLSLLGFFKYADFFIGIMNAVTGSKIPLLRIPLPLGISFYTFQTMSYTIDVYRNQVRATRNLSAFAAYVCLFPQLIAGPIVRYSDVAAELDDRRTDIDSFALGIRRFVIGLAKKVLIANTMGELCSLFRASEEKTVLFYWLYAAAFMLQVYFDFSGYSDMAIGLGKMFGFSFPENFDYPYMSRSVTEFWRRWHMTMGGWFRDYVYIPLGGNRVSGAKWLRNIFVVWLLTGLWHGAAWNFVIWGVMFGILLVLEKLWLNKILQRAGRFLSHAYVLLIVMLSMVLFNGDGLSGAWSDLSGMFGGNGAKLIGVESLYYLRSYAVPLLTAFVGATPAAGKLWESAKTIRSGSVALTILEPLTIIALFAAVTAYLIDGSFNPFLYFRF